MTNLIGLSRILAAAALTAVVLPSQCPAGGYQTGSQVGGGSSGGMAGTPAVPSPGSPSVPHPSSPTTPGPTTPSAPDAPHTGGPTTTQPTTGGPRNAPAAGARAGRTGARGAAMTFERGKTSKSRLKLDWTHPVPPERGDGTSAAGALPRAEALKVLWGDDQRPLLVMRECSFCQGTDLPLLNQSMNNDRTKLLASWFRIVKLPPHVMEPAHPFHNVFAGFEFAGPMPHFYLLSHPDAEPVAFSGQPTQAHLLKSMTSIVKQRYQFDPGKAIKKWVTMLDKFDNIDADRKRVKEQLREARAKRGPRSSRAKSLQARIDDLDMERTKLLGRERKVRDLILHPFPKPKTPAGAK